MRIDVKDFMFSAKRINESQETNFGVTDSNIVCVQCLFRNALTGRFADISGSAFGTNDRRGMDFETYYRVDRQTMERLLATSVFASNIGNSKSITGQDEVIDILAGSEPFAAFRTNLNGERIIDDTMSRQSQYILKMGNAQRPTVSAYKFAVYVMKDYSTLMTKLFVPKSGGLVLKPGEFTQVWRGKDVIGIKRDDNITPVEEFDVLNPFIMCGYWQPISYDESSDKFVCSDRMNKSAISQLIARTHGKTTSLFINAGVNSADGIDNSRLAGFIDAALAAAGRTKGGDQRRRVMRAVAECDGGCAAGGDGCGSAAAGMSSDAILGPSGGFEKGQGCMGPGDFHVPFPVTPMLRRYGWTTSKKKADKNAKTVKNPYVGKVKTIIGEAETEPFVYTGEAAKYFNEITGGVQEVFSDVLNYNDRMHMAWKVNAETGYVQMYKPIDKDGVWSIVTCTLLPDAMIRFENKAGRFASEREALEKIYAAYAEHKRKLQEALAADDRTAPLLDETRFSARDMMKWEAHGRDPRYAPTARRPSVNVPYLKADLKRRFPHQFEDVELRDQGGTWQVTFVLPLPDGQREIRGQQRVAIVIPEINRIVAFLRTRGVETNQYDVSAICGGAANSARTDESLSGQESTKLRQDMKNGVVKFKYRKAKDGTTRVANGTLKKELMPKFDKEKPAKPNSVRFTYWDTDKKNFRSFKRKNFIGRMTK